MKFHPLFFVFVFAVCNTRGDVSLPTIISDNMVLQQKTNDNIWGRAEPGEKVNVSMAGKTASAVANSDGKWAVKLGPIKNGGPFEMTVSGNNTIIVHNVAVGEVWLAAGESNMEFKMADVDNASEEIAAANYPMIRMFTVARKGSEEPQTDCDGKWEICDPNTVKNFSAVGYFFANDLNKKLKSPIGIIHASRGGSPAEAWTPPAALEADADLKPILDQVTNSLNSPAHPVVSRSPLKATRLFNGMIAPLIPYSIKGAIWYQGEANAGTAARALQYRKLFPALISGLRKSWGEGDFPFLFVQLSTWRPSPLRPTDSAWAILREAQAMALKLPKTGMAVSIDIGDRAHTMNIHPRNKKDVGRRLALISRATVYGDEDVTYSGPIYASTKIKGDRIEIAFKPAKSGLVDRNGPPLKGFAIAGADKKFVWAEAKIEGKKVVVHADGIVKPIAVRYAWGETPDCDLSNEEGLPAVPFRTDDWDKVTPAPKPTPSSSPVESAATPVPETPPAASPTESPAPAPAATPEASASPATVL